MPGADGDKPATGTYVRDPGRRGRVGRVMDVLGTTVWLRAPGGGTEWTAPARAVRPLAPGEAPGD